MQIDADVPSFFGLGLEEGLAPTSKIKLPGPPPVPL